MVEFDSESLDASTIEKAVTPNHNVMEEVPTTFSRKRKYRERDEVSDPIVDKAVDTLQALETALHTPAEPIVKSDMQLYGEYIGRELQSIGDEEIVNDAKHAINNILYDSKKNGYNGRSKTHHSLSLKIFLTLTISNLNKRLI